MFSRNFGGNRHWPVIRDKYGIFCSASGGHIKLFTIYVVVYGQRAVMLCGREGNRRSGVALAMRHRLQWFIHLRAQRL